MLIAETASERSAPAQDQYFGSKSVTQVTFVTEPFVDLPTAGFNSHASENEQCYEAHAYSVPAAGT